MTVRRATAGRRARPLVHRAPVGGDPVDIRRALDRLETVVEDLANVMKQGQLVDEPTAVDLAATVRACLDLLDPAEATL